jgi:hypothetical protein
MTQSRWLSGFVVELALIDLNGGPGVVIDPHPSGLFRSPAHHDRPGTRLLPALQAASRFGQQAPEG